MILKTGYLNEVQEQVAYSQHQFDKAQKECMLSMALGFNGDMIHRSVLAFESLGFFQGFKRAFCETGYNSVL